MTDLTEQWKKGELPEGFYYVKCDWSDEVEIRYVHNGVDDWKAIVAPVPSYDEWRAKLDDNKRLKHDVGNLGYKIKNQRHEIDNRLKEIEKLTKQKAELKEIIEKDKKVFAEARIYPTHLISEDFPVKYDIDKLKELLKECRSAYLNAEKNYGYDDSILEICSPMIDKIDEVLK